ncbi:hypothetical protein [Dyadobacter sp. CY312]|uniref:hypothetical protein n=1 Tax=Dyadobacter sp. CY312 TaxID=2907303 RepID=UPI001F401F59|nr:hypothetical protein [Dyadobacter sp. CY312]MCE7039528.1 hypothetical protein [Dyadobacter sp. CY312]
MTKSISCGGFILGLFFALPAFSQYAGDVFRYSEVNQNGTARFQGLGGNHAAIGGDASSLFGNPAGLGFYSRSEIAISPAVTSVNNKTTYIGDVNSSGKGNFNIAHASAIFTSQPGFQRKWKRSSFGIAYSRQQSFREVYNYTGYNTKSAYVNKVAEDVNRGGGISTAQLEADFDAGTASMGPLAYSLPSAYYNMYLINPTGVNGPPYVPLDNSSALEQVGSYSATGANTQWSLSYAGNYDDKLYVGATIGFSRIKYDYDRLFTDIYVDSPDIIAVDQQDGLSVRGNGANLSFGVIYKLNPSLQLGGVLTSPTWSSIKETFSQGVGADFVDGKIPAGPEGALVPAPYDFIPVKANEFVYRISSPFKGSFGATYFVKGNGFITGSLEYVGYGAMRANTSYLSDADNTAFKDETVQEIKDAYRNTVNVRVGGEYRAGLFRGRVGAAYIADPYLERADIDRSKLVFSAGVGVRNDRFFADVAGTLTTFKSAYTPYFLNNPADYSSVIISNRTVNVMLTVGTFF